MPECHPELTRAQILDPETAMDYCARKLYQWYSRFRSWGLAVACWHAGEGTVSKSAPCLPKSFDIAANIATESYVRQVLSRARVPFDVQCGSQPPEEQPDMLPGNNPTQPVPTGGGIVGNAENFRKVLILGAALLLLLVALSRMK